jgi:hypothetical protein
MAEAWSGEVEATSGAVETEQLSDPERACLSESLSVVEVAAGPTIARDPE